MTIEVLWGQGFGPAAELLLGVVCSLPTTPGKSPAAGRKA